MRKKLIFFIYIGDDRSPQERISEGIVAKIHFNCLKKYRDVFDEAKFVLSVKEELLGNSKLISEYVEYLINLGYFENIEFSVEKNTPFRESKTFKEEILDNKDNEGKLVFFAHLRGEAKENEQMARWVFANYFYSLSNIWELEYWLVENMKVFYGFPLVDFRNAEVKPCEINSANKFYFPGSMYWTNVSLLKNMMRSRGIDTPKLMNRFYTENFPGDVATYEIVSTANYTSAPRGFDCYTNFDGLLGLWCASSGRSIYEFNDEYEKTKMEV